VKGLVRLSNHLVQVHRIKDTQQRQHWLDVAKKTHISDYQELIQRLDILVTQQKEILAQQHVIQSQLLTRVGWIPDSNIRSQASLLDPLEVARPIL
jgi:hypothetical protein